MSFDIADIVFALSFRDCWVGIDSFMEEEAVDMEGCRAFSFGMQRSGGGQIS